MSEVGLDRSMGTFPRMSRRARSAKALSFGAKTVTRFDARDSCAEKPRDSKSCTRTSNPPRARSVSSTERTGLGTCAPFTPSAADSGSDPAWFSCANERGQASESTTSTAATFLEVMRERTRIVLDCDEIFVVSFQTIGQLEMGGAVFECLQRSNEVRLSTSRVWIRPGNL